MEVKDWRGLMTHFGFIWARVKKGLEDKQITRVKKAFRIVKSRRHPATRNANS